jgi:LytTr DNA-binding domain
MNNLTLIKTFIAFFIAFLLCPFVIFSQELKIDSLWAILKSPEAATLPYADLYKIQKEYIKQNTNDPAKRVEQLTRASLFFLQQHPDTSMVLSNEAEKIAETSNNDGLKAMAYMKAENNYVEIHTTHKKELIRANLGHFLERINKKNFFRTHTNPTPSIWIL